MVLLTNCDKITPGMLMAAGRLNIPAVVVTGGPMDTGCHRGQRVCYTDLLETDENPFPGVCGRVCFRFCQKPCHRKHIDTQIKIGALEKLAANYGRNKRNLNPDIKPNGLCVTIIGAGPAGLSCAYFLARLGYKVDIFDSQSETGGSLKTNKKLYDRLPEHILESETQDTFALGVNFFPNHTLSAKPPCGESHCFPDWKVLRSLCLLYQCQR